MCHKKKLMGLRVSSVGTNNDHHTLVVKKKRMGFSNENLGEKLNLPLRVVELPSGTCAGFRPPLRASSPGRPSWRASSSSAPPTVSPGRCFGWP